MALNPRALYSSTLNRKKKGDHVDEDTLAFRRAEENRKITDPDGEKFRLQLLELMASIRTHR